MTEKFRPTRQAISSERVIPNTPYQADPYQADQGSDFLTSNPRHLSYMLLG